MVSARGLGVTFSDRLTIREWRKMDLSTIQQVNRRRTAEAGFRTGLVKSRIIQDATGLV